MNNFEFLRYLTIGQYLPTGSVIHRLDPRAKLVALFLLLVAVTLTRDVVALWLTLALVLALLLVARVPIGFALRSLLPPLPFLLILAVLQLFFPATPGTEPAWWSWWLVRVTPSSALAALTLLIRFGALILLLGLASYSISTSELIYALERLLRPLAAVGIPTRDFVMVVQVMLRFLPFLAQAAERIAKAQASRGAEWGTGRGGLLRRIRQTFPLIVPLFLTGLRRASNLAVAMEARGYGAHEAPHTTMLEYHFRARDALVLAAALLLSAAILFGSRLVG